MFLNTSKWLRTLQYQNHAHLCEHWCLLKTLFWCAGNQSLSATRQAHQGTLTKVNILQLAKFPADPHRGILSVPSKSAFKLLILETLLWQGAMISNLKFPSKGLKD
jgi:hypothetical protein